MPNLAKRLLISIVIDISPSTGFKNTLGAKTPNELINEKLKSFIAQLCSNRKIRSSAEVCFVLYSTNVEVKPFVPLKSLENNVPRFSPVKSGGTRTASAMNAAYDAIHEKARLISGNSLGGGLYTSVVILLTDGDVSVHDSDDMIKDVTRRINACTVKESRAEKVLPIIVGLGDSINASTQKMLAEFNRGFVDDGFFWVRNDTDEKVDDNLTRLFKFFSQSIVASVRVGENSVDVLLNELRSLVEEAYTDTLCKV